MNWVKQHYYEGKVYEGLSLSSAIIKIIKSHSHLVTSTIFGKPLFYLRAKLYFDAEKEK